ncbi:MAG: cyclic nucleotide-binding domain-containing protein [Oscillospiraceae bacterium]|jgi:hypothetical protein|nr:cyclic nucleotide-binding domain-containing protein [Oscillospiraceae bacterium]
MALTEFKQGSVICSEGDPLQQLLLIMRGSVESAFDAYPFRLEKGDIVGLCGFGAGSHSHTCTAVTDVAVISYPYDSFDALETLLRENVDAANLLVNSMCHQVSDHMQCWSALKQEAGGAYELLQEMYPEYVRLCRLYALTPKKLPGLEEAERFSGPDTIEDWLHDYYMEIYHLGGSHRKGFFYCHQGISSGFLRRGAEDVLQVLQSCKRYHEYIAGLSKLFLNEDGHDLFSLISELHYNSINIRGADAAVETLMARLLGLLSDMTGVDPAYYQSRLSAYKDALLLKRGSQEVTDAPDASSLKQNLSDSLHIILDYSGCPEDVCNQFTHCVHDYTKLPDRGGSDDDARRLRKDLTKLFYILYQNVFFKTLEDPAPPTVIKMFLNFGYVDATLAGHENADYLYSIADSVKGDADLGVYTIREWLTAVYNGKKEPNRNEFDLDYGEYIHELKVQGKIDEKEEKRLLGDMEGKLRFEIENVFPIVNKITFGRITIFCPVFADHNVQRKLDTSLITPALIRERIDEIRSIDFSAYSREILFSNTKCEISNETIHVEVLPDFILTPNVGIRGAMWQEIEGRKRATPARIFLPLFLEGDLKALMIRLTAEFRWEMCKRIQGMRWNDVTNPSLTSMFCDYLQFYKGNRELSAEVKEGIKIELMRAKNNYKMVFAADYAEWLLYESNGSPRLNKFVVSMMLTFCPFSAEVRERLIKNPRYAEMLNRYNIKQQQTIQRLSNVMQKANRVGGEIPQDLQNEMEFAKS